MLHSIVVMPIFAYLFKQNTMKKAPYVPSSDSDELNPRFMFSLTHTELLSAIANGKINPVEYAKRELANRGLNNDGRWIGFSTVGRQLVY